MHRSATTLPPATQPAPLIETLRAGLATEPTIAKAWLVEARAPLATAGKAREVIVRVDALILVVDPFDAAQRPCDSDAVRARQQRALADLIEPNALPVVMVFYATELPPKALQVALEQLPAGSTYVR